MTGRDGGGEYVLLADGDWIRTVRQSLPVMRQVLAGLRPTWEFESAASIDGSFLSAAGIRALIWDVDGTLSHRGAPVLAPEVADAFAALTGDAGLRHLILSNCGESRYEELSRLFPSIPVVKGYTSGAGPVFRTRTGSRQEWSREPRGELRPIRKPAVPLIDFALQLLEVEDRSKVAVIGDQYLTDVACANMAGVRSIKVATLGAASFPFPVRLLQRVDRWLHLALR